jgi:tRNA threonylcarbamoyladenosine biosynthesis protein TsaB
MATYILQIDTSTPICSVSLSLDGVPVANVVAEQDNMHAANLTLLIESLFEQSKVPLADISAIAISKGPGSYTGLRIGVSTAKGLAYALNKPIIGINSLKNLASGFLSEKRMELPTNSLLVPMIDARRMEVYRAIYNVNLDLVLDTEAVILDANTFESLQKEHFIVLFGTGANKLKELYANQDNLVIYEQFPSHASYMSEVAYQLFLQNKFDDLAYFEPYYLKDYIPTTPKKIF